jgi:arylformamidase
MNTHSFTTAEIDTDLNLSGSISSIKGYIDDFKTRSARVLQTYQFTALEYGEDVDENYIEAGVASADQSNNLVVFIHGGNWRAYSAEDFAFVGARFLENRHRFISLNYSPCPIVTMSGIVGQVIRAMTKIAQRHPYAEIHLVGHSAGAHLALLACYTNWWKQACYPRNPVVRCSMLSGLFDLEPISRSFLKSSLGLTPLEIATLSPINLIPNPEIAYRLLVGDREAAIYQRQSEELEISLCRVGASVVRERLINTDHLSILYTDLF